MSYETDGSMPWGIIDQGAESEENRRYIYVSQYHQSVMTTFLIIVSILTDIL